MAVSKPNRNSLWGLGMYHGKASGTPVKAVAEGCEVLRPSKAAAEVLRVSRPMLTHLEPQAPKNGKKWEEHKTP